MSEPLHESSGALILWGDDGEKYFFPEDEAFSEMLVSLKGPLRVIETMRKTRTAHRPTPTNYATGDLRRVETRPAATNESLDEGSDSKKPQTEHDGVTLDTVPAETPVTGQLTYERAVRQVDTAIKQQIQNWGLSWEPVGSRRLRHDIENTLSAAWRARERTIDDHLWVSAKSLIVQYGQACRDYTARNASLHVD